jgi:hypothetical protein
LILCKLFLQQSRTREQPGRPSLGPSLFQSVADMGGKQVLQGPLGSPETLKVCLAAAVSGSNVDVTQGDRATATSGAQPAICFTSGDLQLTDANAAARFIGKIELSLSFHFTSLNMRLVVSPWLKHNQRHASLVVTRS